MSTIFAPIVPKVEKADVPRILVPDTVSFATAAEYCAKKAEEEQAEVKMNRVFKCLPWGGALAIQRVLDSTYSATKDARQYNPPKMEGGMDLDVDGAGGKRPIWWGRWNIAGIGWLWQTVTIEDGLLKFQIVVNARRMFRPMVELLFSRITTEVEKRELYRGCAIQLKPNEDGQLDLQTPPPVLTVPTLREEEVILSRKVGSAVRAELFSAITKADELAKRGVPTRRGVMLAGRPGTGKTMSATVAASLAIARGWAVFYLADSRAFEQALAIAGAHEPALLIIEDIDRQLSGERSAETDRILNALSGLDNNQRLIVICTSNDASDLPAPMLRPGRLDSFIVFDAPDQHAAAHLLRRYLGVHAPTDLTKAGVICAGLLPACIREVATRSILHAVTNGNELPSDGDIEVAASTVRQQQDILEAQEAKKFRMPKAEIKVVHVTPPGQSISHPLMLASPEPTTMVAALDAAEDD